MINLVKRFLLIGIFCTVLAGFGLLAYIIGQTQAPQARLKALLCPQGQHIAQAFFSPDDDMSSVLVDLIASEQKKITIAVYIFTHAGIARALVEAQERGVEIQIVTDRTYGADRYSKIPLLANNHIPVWVYQTDVDECKASIMHNKFCVFTDNIDHKSILWTGSYNFTKRATESNQENVVVLDSSTIVQKFNKQFELLKTRSLVISGQPGRVYKPQEKPTRAQRQLWSDFKKWLNKILLPV